MKRIIFIVTALCICLVSGAQQRLYRLKPIDTCENGPHCPTSVIAVDSLDTNATNWEWEFQCTNCNEANILTHVTSSNRRFIRIYEVENLIPAYTYNVRIRPIYENKESFFGPPSCIVIAACFYMSDGNRYPLPEVWPDADLIRDTITNDTLQFMVSDFPKGKLTFSIFKEEITAPYKYILHESFDISYSGESILNIPVQIQEGNYQYMFQWTEAYSRGKFTIAQD